MIPAPWQFVLLALAAYRLWRLIAMDDITEPLRDRVTGRLYAIRGGDETHRYHATLDKFIGCPWCFGYWISVGLWWAWYAVPHWTLVVSVPFAISAAVGLVSKNLDA